jgi:hypothetical protein
VTINECYFNSLHHVPAIHLTFLDTVPLLNLHGETEAEGILQWTYSTQNRNCLPGHWEGTEMQKREGEERNDNSNVLFKAFSYTSFTV